MDYLNKLLNTYDQTTEEYYNTQQQIEEAESEQQIKRQQKVAELIADYAAEYNKKSNEQKAADEIAILKTLVEKKILTEEEYQKAVRAIRKKYNTGTNSSGNFEAYEGGKFRNEYSDMVVNLWKGISSFIDGSSTKLLDKISSTAQAAFAIMQSATAAYSEYAKADQEYQIAIITKAYDRRISLAKNNAARQKRLEEARDREIAAKKAEAAENEFEISLASAIAQTALNAIMAYQAGLKIGGPAGLALAPIAAAMAVAAGAIQIATITRQKDAAMAAGYSEGGFTAPGDKDEPAGIVHAGEWVASQKLVNNPRTRPIINMLEQAQRNNTFPSITSGDVSRSIVAPMVTAERVSPALMTAVAAESTGRSAAALDDNSATNAALRSAVVQLSGILSRPIRADVSVSGPTGFDRAQRQYNQLIKNKNS